MKQAFTKDTLLILLTIVGGGTIIKLLGLQTYYTLFVLIITIYVTIREDFKVNEILVVLLIMFVMIGFQLIHSSRALNYELLSTQFLRSLVNVVLGYLIAKRYKSREIIFVKNTHYILLVLIVHAILSVLVVKFFGHDTVIFTSPNDGAVYRGPSPIFAVRWSTDINGFPVNSNVLGLGLERAHGIFWEPSVFVNYVAIFIYINLFLRFNIWNVLLGLSAIVLAWSSTGFLLAAFIVVAFVFFPNKFAKKAFKSKLNRLRSFMLIAGVPVMMTFLWINITSISGDSRKLGSASQRFYDTAGAILAIAEHPAIGSGVNLDSYSSALSEDENFIELDDLSKSVGLNNKADIKFSNSFLRFFVAYGIPFSMILFFGLYRQTMIDSKSKVVLFFIVVIGTSFSPILELMFFMPFIYSGLIFGIVKN